MVINDLDNEIDVLPFLRTMTFSRCKICDCEMLFHFDAVAKHCSTAHQLTLKTYRTEYRAFTGQTEYNQTKKINPPERQANRKLPAGEKAPNRKSTAAPVQLDAASLEWWRPTVDGSRKYLSDNLNETCLRWVRYRCCALREK